MSTATRTQSTARPVKVARTRRISDTVAQALSSDGKTVYTVSLADGTCDCPAGRNARACYHVATATARYVPTDGPTFLHRAYFTTLRRAAVVIDASARFATSTVIDATARFRPDDDDTPPAAPAAAALDFGDILVRLAEVASELRDVRGYDVPAPRICRDDCESESWVTFGRNHFCTACRTWVRPATEWHAYLTAQLRQARAALPAAA